MKIKIQEYLNDESIVEFTIEGIDYQCQYIEEKITQAYPVSHNSFTDTIDCETNSFLYKFPIIESLKREDNVIISDKEGISKYLELEINS